MKWSIPAKTFFLGEYAAMAGAPAILLTTTPCFEITLLEQPGLNGIHPDSPAGLYWLQQHHAHHGLSWHDPYQGQGGLGASSAQWLGAYYAHHYLQQTFFSQSDLLDAYFKSAWQGIGAKPSGYDVIAQAHSGCVFVHQHKACETFTWPFTDLSFILLHTGKKMATHHHLQSFQLTQDLEQMRSLVESAKTAFECVDSLRIIDAVNAYHTVLLQHHLVAEHSLELINQLTKQKDILAIKGCGAMGADVLLLLVPSDSLVENKQMLMSQGYNILSTSENLSLTPKIITKNT